MFAVWAIFNRAQSYILYSCFVLNTHIYIYNCNVLINYYHVGDLSYLLANTLY